MRAVHYMKIDYMLTRQQLRILPLLALVGVMMARSMKGVGVLVASAYLLFMAVVFATTPFGSCHRRNTGFLLLLPATVRERVMGRFLYGLSYMAAVTLFCLGGMGAAQLLGYEITRLTLGLFLCNVAAGVFIIALEYLFFYLFGVGKDNWLYLGNLVKIAPAMAMYFLSMYVAGKMDEETYVVDRMEFLLRGIVSTGLLALAAALFFMALAAAVSVKVIGKRDYA